MSQPAGRIRTWAPWAALVMVLGVGIWIGTGRSGPPPSLDQQVRVIAAEVRCPSCSDLNSAQSNDVTAVAVRAAIRSRLATGESRAQIESYLASRYGPDILLRPPTHGFGSLVWVLPVLAAVAALAGVGWASRRWRPGSAADVASGVDADDEALVRRALVREASGSGSSPGP